ncbi:hypothetical protein [uncultured Mediterranean phage uvMED]|nr:hypothetical protein [uncultured Mediterranean phage uvMED]
MAREPFFGRTPGPQIARMDVNQATAPGRMFAQSLTQLGQAVGGAIAKYGENKKKKEDQKINENAFISMGLTPEEAKAASRDPSVASMIGKFKEMGFRRGGGGGSPGSPPSTFAERKYNKEQQEEAELEEEIEAGNRFLLQRGEERMPTSEEGRYSVLKNLRAGKGVTPPARMVREDSPAVSQLPESFKPFGRDVEKAVEAGEITERVGISLIQEKQAIAQAEAEREREFQEKIALEQFKNDLKNQTGERDLSGSMVVNDAISRAFPIIGPFSTGFGSYLKSVPLTDAKSLDTLFTTIKANIGFDKLQAMREASPTGGALGQVSNQELSSLQSVFGNLDQSQDDEQLKYNLRMLQHVYNNVVHGVGNHPFKHPMDTSEVVAPNAPASDSSKKRLQELQEMKRKRSQR